MFFLLVHFHICIIISKNQKNGYKNRKEIRGLGNPGDGKTAFLEKIGAQLKAEGASAQEWDANNGWHYVLNGHHFIANYDASESSSGRRFKL